MTQKIDSLGASFVLLIAPQQMYPDHLHNGTCYIYIHIKLTIPHRGFFGQMIHIMMQQNKNCFKNQVQPRS